MISEGEKFFFVGNRKVDFKDNFIILVQGFLGGRELILEKNDLWSISSILLMKLLNQSYFCFSDIEKIISEIPILDTSKNDLKQKLMKISTVFENTNSIISKMDELFEVQNKTNLILKLLDIYFKKQNLIKEKNWASYIEAKSRESSKLSRIDILTNKILELEKNIKSEEPDYKFLKKRIEVLNTEKSDLKKQALSNNKMYMEKTREFNKIRRNLDELNESLEIYNQKIEELSPKTKNTENIKQNEEYLRVSKKQNDVKSQIDGLSGKKSGLTNELKELKEKILLIKQKSSEINSSISKIKPKYKISQDSYLDLLEQLESSKNQLDQIRNDLLETEQKNSGKISSIEKPKGDKPQIIRYSKIIESEIVEADNLITRISSNLKLKRIDINENNILQLFENIEMQFKSLTSSNISMDFDSQELLDFIKAIQIKLEEFKKCFNSLLAPLGVTCKISRIPVFLPMENLKLGLSSDQKSEQKTGNSMENFGYKFSFLDREKKEIIFEEQKKQTKLFILLMSITAINTTFGVSDNYFFEEEMDPKLMNKGILKKIITILHENSIKNSTEIKNKYIFLIKKFKFQKNEFQKLKKLEIIDLNGNS